MRLTPQIEVSGLRDDGVPVLRLNPLQQQERRSYLDRLRDGTYRQLPVEACPLCSHTDAFLVAEKDRYGLPLRTAVCQRCGLVFTLNPLDDGSANRFYASQYRNLYEGRRVADGERRAEIDELFRSRDMYSGLCRDLPSLKDFGERSLVVEVGAGAGWNLAAFQRRSIPVLGTDFDRELVQVGNEKGIPMIEGSVKDLIARGIRADLVILNHILEHLREPYIFLEEVIRLVKPGGHVFVGVPGLHALRLGEWGGDLAHTLQNAHTFLFEMATLEALAARAGLEVLVGRELIWSIFQHREEALPQMNWGDGRGAKVIAYLRSLRVTGPLWKAIAGVTGGHDSGTMQFCRGAVGAMARRLGVYR